MMGKQNSQIQILRDYEENILEKENMPNIPETAKAVMRQQFLLIQALEDWIATVRG